MPFANVPDFPVDLSVGNDKTIVVPAGETWEVRGVFCTFSTLNNAGARLLTLEFIEPNSDVIMVKPWGEIQVANVVKRHAAAPQLLPSAEQTGVQLYIQIPVLWFLPGWAIRVFDINDLDVLDTVAISVNRVRHSTQ